jgi:hypothetical protein
MSPLSAALQMLASSKVLAMVLCAILDHGQAKHQRLLGRYSADFGLLSQQ